jgi:4-carboxymuconolactone decarboxylase
MRHGKVDFMMNDANRIKRAREMAKLLFSTMRSGTGFELWKQFDEELARELSTFFTGVLYSREVIPQKTRELCACASLMVLGRGEELRAHIHAALNVGATRAEVAEVIFQQVTYGGMPVVAKGLQHLRDVLAERGEWKESGATP